MRHPFGETEMAVDKLGLIDSILPDVIELGFDDSGTLDAIRRRAKMIIAKLFGDKSKYLTDIDESSFYPMIAPSTEKWERESWCCTKMRRGSLGVACNWHASMG